MTLKVAEMSETVKKFFTEDAEHTARETGFVQRTSKMTGSLWASHVGVGPPGHTSECVKTLGGILRGSVRPSHHGSGHR